MLLLFDEQLLQNVHSIRSTYRRLCAELHRDIGQLRDDIAKLTTAHSRKGAAYFCLAFSFAFMAWWSSGSVLDS